MRKLLSWVGRTPVLALVMVGMLLVGCATDRKVIAQAEDVHTGLKPAVIANPELSGYVQKVGDRIIVAAREAYQEGYRPKKTSEEDSNWMFSQGMQFHFVSSDQLNAFTTGGEHMYIYSKLFEQCRSEDELAAVMAHEFAHVFGRHVQSGMNRQTTMVVGAAAAGAAGYALGKDESRLTNAAGFAGAAMAAGQFFGMGWTRGDEREADAMGFDFYVRAGWDPKKFSDFFQQMIDLGYDKTPEMLSDHPTLASRVAETQQRVAKLPADASKYRKPPVADAQQFKALQALAVKADKAMPKDDSLAGAKLLLASFSSCVAPVDSPEQKAAQAKLARIRSSLQSR